MELKRVFIWIGPLITAVLLLLNFSGRSTAQTTPPPLAYLPVIYNPVPTPTPTSTPTPTITPTPEPTATPSPTPTMPPAGSVELRGLWISRFDWTSATQPAQPSKIDEMVDNAAYAGFNAIFFQVRGVADAFYTPGIEPWSQRMTGGVLGQAPDPHWDPLQRLIERAHGYGMEVHAYINVYPLWDCSTTPPQTTPQHLYHKVAQFHGYVNGDMAGVQWYNNSGAYCFSYIRTSPASIFVDDHLVAVGRDLVTRYNIDGLHLDHIRYGGRAASCDPVSMYYAPTSCFGPGFADWQRTQVNGTVARFYHDVISQRPGVMLSAAVWPIHTDQWGWGATQGYHDYYQDSKAWVAGGYVDAIMPMIYTSNYETDTFWTLSKWQILVADFQANAAGRWVIPGIGTGYANFSEIENRINAGRQIGVPGHALFSYGDLLSKGYFDELRNGPYAQPAVPPTITWHP